MICACVCEEFCLNVPWLASTVVRRQCVSYGETCIVRSNENDNKIMLK